MNEALLAAAYRMQQAGNAAEAARLYGEILKSNPRHFRALYLLAYLHFGAGSFETAERLFEEAAKLDPNFIDAHFARGCALQNLQRHEAAIQSFDKALALKRDYADAFVNRGVNLLDLNRPEDGLRDFDKALAIDPHHVEAHVNRGAVLLDMKRYGEALSSLDRAVGIAPNHATALINRANALNKLGRANEALSGYDMVLTGDPSNIEALSNRGVALLELKRYAEALQSFDRVLGSRPDRASAWFNRGNVFLKMRRFADALVSFDKALALEPNNVDALVNCATVFLGERRFEDALQTLDRALSLDPRRADALGNRAATLFELRRYEEALADGEKLVANDPDYPYAKGLVVRCRLHCCDWRLLAGERTEIDAGVNAGKPVIQPFAYLSLSDSPEALCACAEIHAVREFPASPSPLWRGERYRHDRIRVAYVSADFRAHAMSYVMAGVFESHDRTRFDTVAVSLGPDDKSAIRNRVAAGFTRFLDVDDKNDDEIARLLREVEIDIAVDLMGFTSASRTGIFASRPAPVSVSYLGFPGTMSAPYIDYILADAVVIPEGAERHYSERIVRLPTTYYPTDKAAIAERTPSREEAGLPPEGFVFCSFNNSYKILPEMFAVWMRLLRAVEGSVLWLLEDNPAASRNLRREAESSGVAGGRLRFAARTNSPEHLARHRLADLFLDTLPYNAHTTASDALWAGLPVLTAMGGTFAGRVAASLNHAVGLSEMVTSSLAGYEALALQLTRNPAALAQLKAKLAQNLRTHPLFDTQRFTRALEVAFQTMRERSSRGEPPISFTVPNSGP